jgi:ubiquitin-protein ligase
VYHPNIDLEGNVCLNILREDWKPVLNINTVIYGLNLLFTVFQLASFIINSNNIFRKQEDEK